MRPLLLACLAATLAAVSVTAGTPAPAPELPEIASPARHTALLDDGWRTFALDTGAPAPAGVETAGFDDRDWKTVTVPHNWDAYEPFRQLRHGDRHGTAWYRRTFSIAASERGRRLFLFFEGVGSYATVWLNGHEVGSHAGGLTTFTLDITDVARPGTDNLLVVRADHPAGIRDLPWVCGGCERANGFSEGTEPFGIFRSVHYVSTAPVRITPFGVHVWNGAEVTAARASIHLETEVRNYDSSPTTVTVVNRIFAPGAPGDDTTVSEIRTTRSLAAGTTVTLAQEPPPVSPATLWSPDSPALYRLETEILGADGTILDLLTTPFGIRTVHWPAAQDADGRFRVNGQPVFLNGICDYEHNLGANHAFTPAQIRARVGEIESAGFNAFRDAHHPHNLRFQEYWDRDGLLWWTQFGAHVWFDNETFRSNFKTLLRDWVRERRNSPSLVLWGLQNESVLPTRFAEECSAIIRELDPTASSQRKITTCNGGTGTDWDVPQNWSGTYSGNLDAYADDLRRERLVGEYGAWRSLGLHTEGGFQFKGPLSEDRMTALLETKVRLAESVRDAVAGQFLWLLTTHSNPGRNVGDQGEQQRDGIRPLDWISPANNKGLFTIWGEPLDAYQMYRGNYANPATEPMVYIVSHTWPDRWASPTTKTTIVAYSNCDEVELYNDLGERSLGRRTRAGRGTHFEWDGVAVTTNVLYAEGRIGGRVVARDIVQLHHLPAARRFAQVQNGQPDLVAPEPGQTYLYRTNCGGPEYTDHNGNRWDADRSYRAGDSWGSVSWADAFPNLDPRFGSQRKTDDPIWGTRDPALFQTFRYGRDQLQYRFTVPNGDYHVELYFAEPWYGDPAIDEPVRPAAGHAYGVGWRQFDVAINGTTQLRDLDLALEAGRDRAVKKVLPVHVTDGRIEISFPRVAAGQAVISAIAISVASPSAGDWKRKSDTDLVTLAPADRGAPAAVLLRHDLDTGDQTYADAPGGFTALPLTLLDADWLQTSQSLRRNQSDVTVQFTTHEDLTVYVASAATGLDAPKWLGDWEPTGSSVATNGAPGVRFSLYRHAFDANSTVTLGGWTATGDMRIPMYTVFLVPRRPAPPAQVTRAADADAGSAGAGSSTIRITGDAETDREIYPDSHTRLVAVPQTLAGGDLIAPGRASSVPFSFAVTDHVEVYVALDARLTTLPAWLQDWSPARETIVTSDSAAPKRILYRRRFTPDSRVQIGAPGPLPSGAPAAACFAIVRAVRPSVFLEAEDAVLTGAVPVSNISGATGTGAVQLSAGGQQAIEWTVRVGVGDRYGLNFRYTAATTTPAITGDLAIIGADGHVVRTDKLEFPSVSHPRAWTYLRTRTGASINAGTYRLRLTLRGTGSIIIDSLEVE